MPEREQWASRVGFVLAAVGSAVGLGNIWRFPWMAAENGGAAFLVVSLVAVLVLGLPGMLAEFVVGRQAHRNVVDAFERIGHPRARVVGAFGLLTGLWILSYYSVVGGWDARYVWDSLTGAYFADPGAYFGAISSGLDALALHALFMAVTVAVVALGVQRGIELATKVMVPAIVVLLVALAAWAATLPGAGEGLAYFLTPQFDVLA